MSLNIQKHKTVDANNITFRDPKINPKYGNVTVPIWYGSSDDASPLVLQIPKMKAFVGVSSYDGDGPPKYSLPVSFCSAQEEAHKNLIKFFDDFDAAVVDAVCKNPSWIKKKKGTSRAVIEAFYTPCIRYPRDKETGEVTDRFPPNLKMKLLTNYETGEFRAKVFDKERQPLGSPDDSIPKGAIVSVLAECTGLWVVNGKFGVSWRAEQIKVDSTPQRGAYAFEDDSDDALTCDP